MRAIIAIFVVISATMPVLAFSQADMTKACNEVWLTDRESAAMCGDLQRNAAELINRGGFDIDIENVEKECYIRNPSDPLAILRCLRRQEMAQRYLNNEIEANSSAIGAAVFKRAMDDCIRSYFPDLATVAYCVKHTAR